MTDQTTLYAYVDEYGNNDLEVGKPGGTDFFICVAVLVDEVQRIHTEAGLSAIRSNLGLGAELKSSKVGSNDDRRAKVVDELSRLDFSYYAVAVDKARVLRDSGLRYKPSFYKYINKLLYRRLYQGILNLQVVADEIGGRPFMESFEQYMQREIKPDLWTEVTFRFSRSADESLIQLADFIAGTLARVLDPCLVGSRSKEFHALLKPHEIGVLTWPPRFWNPVPQDDIENEWDNVLALAAVERACQFLAEYEDSDDENRQMQVVTLNHLLYQSSFTEKKRAIVAGKLIEHLVRQGFQEPSGPAFSSKVIGSLRDAGIVLSGGSDGYRLASCYADIRRYLDHGVSVIEPMILRIQKAREQVKLATNNSLDILDDPVYGKLKAVTEEFSRIGLVAAPFRPSEEAAEEDEL